jgi:hypothetical protein
LVFLQGNIKNGTIGAAAFTLPAGYRPPAAVSFETKSNDAIAGVSILSNGEVYVTFGSNAGVSLDGMFFFTA